MPSLDPLLEYTAMPQIAIMGCKNETDNIIDDRKR